MLLLSRKIKETIRVFGPCTVVVLGVKNGRVQLGVEADPEVKILRGEVPDRDEKGGSDER